MRAFLASTLLILAAAMPTSAEVIRVASPHSVEETVARLETAATGAGATIFAKVPHSEGAANVGVELAPMTLLIFGSPKIGAPVFQAAPETGLVLPLRVLAYEDAEGQVWLAYEEPGAMLTAKGLPEDAEAIGRIGKALEMFTGKAVAE